MSYLPISLLSTGKMSSKAMWLLRMPLNYFQRAFGVLLLQSKSWIFSRIRFAIFDTYALGPKSKSFLLLPLSSSQSFPSSLPPLSLASCALTCRSIDILLYSSRNDNIKLPQFPYHSSTSLILGLATKSWYCWVDQSRISFAKSCHSVLSNAPSLLISYCEYNSSVSSRQYYWSQSRSLSWSSYCMICTYSVLSSLPSLSRSQASKCSFTLDYMYPFTAITHMPRSTNVITFTPICSFLIVNHPKKIQNNAPHLFANRNPNFQPTRQVLNFVGQWAVDINFNIQSHRAFKMQQEREQNKKKPQEPHDDKGNLKKTVLQQLKALKPQANATAEEAVDCLVKQAEYYTNFLLSKHEILRKSTQPEPKKRGHFEQQDEEIEIMIEEEEQEENIFTRLTEQPTVLRGGVLKYYQLVGLNWMISLYESGISGILADDMGLGKTIQTISILAFIKQYKKVNGPHIIIAPKITLGNWMNEFQKWLPCAKVVKLIATKDERQEILTQVVDKGKFDILVTSFQGVRICLNSLKKIKWHYIVIDEAHKIKNEDSQLSQVVRKLHTECKLLLTGTPLQNNLHELWSLLNFLLPEIFSNSELFDNWFNSTSDQKLDNQQEIEKKNIQMIGQLHKILKPFMLRRTKLEVQKNLPPKKEVHIYVGLTEVQLKIYKNLLQNRNASEDEKKYYLNLLMQLRKVCNHPYLFPGIQSEDSPSMGEHLIETSGKLIILDQLLKKLYAEGGHKVLIFSQMTMVLDILEDYCNYRMYSYCRIDGSTDMNSRDSQIEQFMSEDSGKYIFLLSTRAGGLGINLTAADTVVIYDSDFNPQMDLQAMDRAHRIGQKNCVNVYRLITENTVQEKIVERQMIKLKWDSLVIQQQKNSQKNKALTKQEMKDMLQYGANFIFKATNGTMTDELIDDILLRGQSKTNALNKQVQEKLKTQQNNLVDFSMNSINIFDFMQQDEKKKREDAEALDEMLAKELQAEYRTTRRDKAKPPNYILDNKGAKRQAKSDKKILVPQHQFFHNKDVLQQLLQKEEDYANSRNTDPPECQPLNEEEINLKNELMQTGFRDWSKQDFNSFITGNQKYGRKNIEQIAALVGKSQADVEKYSAVFWARLDQLSQKDRIMKQIQNGEDKISSRKLHEQLLEWKASRCYEIEFNPAVYTKFRSKLFSIDADRFLAQNIYKLGLRNMSLVKEKIRVQSMFRFDHFLRSRTESELNKRMLSIYKLIQKQKDNDEYGLDNQTLKETKKKQKKRKQEQKEGIVEQQDQNDQEFSRDKKKKIKQTSITSYAKTVMKEEIQ